MKNLTEEAIVSGKITETEIREYFLNKDNDIQSLSDRVMYYAAVHRLCPKKRLAEYSHYSEEVLDAITPIIGGDGISRNMNQTLTENYILNHFDELEPGYCLLHVNVKTLTKTGLSRMASAFLRSGKKDDSMNDALFFGRYKALNKIGKYGLPFPEDRKNLLHQHAEQAVKEYYQNGAEKTGIEAWWFWLAISPVFHDKNYIGYIRDSTINAKIYENGYKDFIERGFVKKYVYADWDTLSRYFIYLYLGEEISLEEFNTIYTNYSRVFTFDNIKGIRFDYTGKDAWKTEALFMLYKDVIDWTKLDYTKMSKEFLSKHDFVDYIDIGMAESAGVLPELSLDFLKKSHVKVDRKSIYDKVPDAIKEETELDRKVDKETNSFMMIFFCIVIAVCIGVFAVKKFDILVMKGGSHISLPVKESTDDKIKEIEDLVKDNTIYDVDSENMQEGIYHGIMEGIQDVDPYAAYASKKEKAEKARESEYVGIGTTVIPAGEGLLVSEVFNGSGAEDAGIGTGDLITAVNGEALKDVTDVSDTVMQQIRGDEGTTVNLTVRKPDGTIKEYTVTRKKTVTPVVTSDMLTENTAYIKVHSFEGKAYDQFKENIEKVLSDKKTDSIVIDLRNNPGGDLDNAVKMLDYVLPDKDHRFTDGKKEFKGNGTLLCYIDDKDGNIESWEAGDGHEIASGIKLSVIVNEQSASASELFSGALQDYQRATIVGVTTYGKGIVQSTYTLTDGSSVKFTTGKYYLPSGRNIHKKGIVPDVLIENTEDTDQQLLEAVEQVSNK